MGREILEALKMVGVCVVLAAFGFIAALALSGSVGP